jgi:hypothetical protein
MRSATNGSPVGERLAVLSTPLALTLEREPQELHVAPRHQVSGDAHAAFRVSDQRANGVHSWVPGSTAEGADPASLRGIGFPERCRYGLA